MDLYLPVARDGAVPARPADRHVEIRMEPITILLTDDEELVRKGTADMLRDLGHQVHEAESGSQAVDRLSSGLRVDALVTDYMMPGINGAELARRARATNPDLPVLVITGYAGGNLDIGLPQLAKPFRRSDLAAALEQVVSGSRGFQPSQN